MGGSDEIHRRSQLSNGAVQHLCPRGHRGQKIGEVLDAIRPEAVYFTDSGVGRGATMIIEIESARQVPHVTEPLMLTFDASVHYRVALSPEDLKAAGLERCATA